MGGSEKTIECPEPSCDKKYLTLYQMKCHYSHVHSGLVRKYPKNKIVNKEFAKKQREQTIKYLALYDENGICKECKKKVKRNRYSHHWKCHFATRDHQCEACGSAFKDKAQLITHQQ